ncbi:hypothetical protein IMSAG044_00885 [Lactobacillaceae bacterium]|nr:hypothetical protein IMSAG044_00885 [Lactobacillaceae bacterium]
MKYLSLALIVMSVSAVPVSGMIVAGKYNKEVDFGEWTFASILIVFTAALAMFH